MPTPRQISLRKLAAELGVNHSSLSAAIHGRRLTHGVQIGARGKVVVVDADAAARQWAAISIPQPEEFGKREAAAQRVASRQSSPTQQAASRVVWWDPDDYDWTFPSLYRCYDATNLVARVLMDAALEGADDRVVAACALYERLTARLRQAAQQRHVDAETLATAERVVWLLDDDDDDDEVKA